MKNKLLLLAVLFLSFGACSPPQNADETATSMPSRPPGAPSAPTGTPTARPILAETLMPSPTPTLSCETHTASATLSVSAATLKVGQAVTITVALDNKGCVGLGLPQYRLYVQSDGPRPIFDPGDPEPVVHYLEIAPGAADAARFALRAVEAGRATLTARASFEVHLGYPGPAYWASSGTGEPVVITVTP